MTLNLPPYPPSHDASLPKHPHVVLWEQARLQQHLRADTSGWSSAQGKAQKGTVPSEIPAPGGWISEGDHRTARTAAAVADMAPPAPASIATSCVGNETAPV